MRPTKIPRNPKGKNKDSLVQLNVRIPLPLYDWLKGEHEDARYNNPPPALTFQDFITKILSNYHEENL